MRKYFVLIAGLALTFALRAGDFKRFYPANPGERIVSLTALPGGGLWLKSQVEKGGGEVNRVLVPSMHRVYRIPDGLTPLAAAAESGILLQQGEKLYFRSLVKAGIFLVYADQKEFKSVIDFNNNHYALSYADDKGHYFQALVSESGIGEKGECKQEGLSYTCLIGGIGISLGSQGRFRVSPQGDFIFQKTAGEMSDLEPISSGKTLIEWGQTAEIGWAVTSVSRNMPLVPPRRLIKIFSAADGTQLANTQIAKEAPEKGLAVAFKMKPDAPNGLAVITGGGMQWWAPKAENIDEWGEITLDLATAKAAE